MLKDYLILKQVISFIIPYIILYSIYIQLNGEVSPGGGFQAGVIFASGIIAFELLFSEKITCKIISEKTLLVCSSMGVLIYGGTGLISLIFEDDFLNYNSLLHDPIHAQHIGIFSIELGVGLTVASVMYLIYTKLQKTE